MILEFLTYSSHKIVFITLPVLEFLERQASEIEIPWTM
jgi:hypothetical protein